LNLYGLVAIIGMALTIYTHPITVSTENEISFDDSLMMSNHEIKKFLLFLLIVSIVYFSSVNIYYGIKNKARNNSKKH
jgi:hypothetical protein